MPKRGKNILSDGELSALFLDIGRAKEAAAQEIIQTKKKEEENRRRALREKFGFLNTGGDSIPDSMDIDETERRLEAEINLVREGKLHKYSDGNESTGSGEQLPEQGSAPSVEFSEVELDGDEESEPVVELLSDVPEIEEPEDVVRPAEHQPPEQEAEISGPAGSETVTLEKDNVAKNNTEDVNDGEDAEVSTAALPSAMSEVEVSDLEIELDEIEEESPSVTACFTSGYNAGRKRGVYAYDVYCGTSLVESVSKVIDANAVETPIFAGATEMLRAVKSTQMYSALLFMTESEEELLRKNAIFGMTGNYGGVAAEYIKCVKELSEECYLTVAPSTASKEMDAVKERVETLLNQ